MAEELAMFQNRYRHCDQIWIDVWSCMCNDRCPICNKEIEPFYSEELFLETSSHDASH